MDLFSLSGGNSHSMLFLCFLYLCFAEVFINV